MDLYVYQLRDSIPLGSVRNIPKTSTEPRRLLLTGRNFERVTEVEVNSLLVDDFTLLQRNLIQINLTGILEQAVITDVQVYSDAVHDLEESRIVPQIGSGFRVTGLQQAVQMFLRWLFCTPGSDAWYPEGGGGWADITSYSNDDEETIPLAELDYGLKRTVQFVQKIQAQDTLLPMTARLSSCTIEGIRQVPGGVSVSLLFRTMAGDSFVTRVRASQ